MKCKYLRPYTQTYGIVKSGDGWTLNEDNILTVFGNFTSIPLEWKDLYFTTVVIGANLPERAFQDCKYLNLVIYQDIDPQQPISTGILGNAGALSGGISVIIEKGVKKIPDFLFSSSTYLTSVVFSPGSNVNCEIGNKAFYGCVQLNNISLSPNVIKIGSQCFDETAWIADKEGNIVLDHVFYRYDINNEQTSYNFSDFNGSVIAGGAFAGAEILESITFPSNIKYIGPSSFNSVESLISVTFSKGLIGIDNGAFDSCIGLSETISLPDGLQYIGNQAFWGCNNFTSLIIPKSLEIIEDEAFHFCARLLTIIFNENSNNIYINKSFYQNPSEETKYFDCKYNVNSSRTEEEANALMQDFINNAILNKKTGLEDEDTFWEAIGWHNPDDMEVVNNGE